MSVARRRALPAILFFLLVACAQGGDDASGGELGPRRERPKLLLLTSLPLAFGQSFSIEAAGSPVLDALEQRYRVLPIATASADTLDGAKLLLLAQPQAQPAENLVELDRWVRSGGRVLLLADPMLEWDDAREVTDVTRPPVMFMDTGLLSHWGLTLNAPGTRGDGPGRIAGQPVTTRSAGALHGECGRSSDGLVARCTIGKGVAMVVADADFLDWSRPGGGAGRAALLAALDQLER